MPLSLIDNVSGCIRLMAIDTCQIPTGQNGGGSVKGFALYSLNPEYGHGAHL